MVDLLKKISFTTFISLVVSSLLSSAHAGYFYWKYDGDNHRNKMQSEKVKKSKKGKKKYADDDVILIVTGEGNTKEEATLSALRSAVEQTYGTFVSSNTQLLNDEIVKDEIVSLSRGNIKEYEYVSDVVLNGIRHVTLQAVVSIGNLVSYVKAKGGSAEISGASFAMDAKMKKLNYTNGLKVFNHLIELLQSEPLPVLFDCSIIKTGKLASNRNGTYYQIPLTVCIKSNQNYKTLRDMIWSTMSAIQCKTYNEYRDYRDAGICINEFVFDPFSPLKNESSCFMASKEGIEIISILFSQALDFVIYDNLGYSHGFWFKYRAWKEGSGIKKNRFSRVLDDKRVESEPTRNPFHYGLDYSKFDYIPIWSYDDVVASYPVLGYAMGAFSCALISGENFHGGTIFPVNDSFSITMEVSIAYPKDLDLIGNLKEINILPLGLCSKKIKNNILYNKED